MNAFDRAYARGPWRLLPVPAFLADRRAGLRFQLAWAGALALLLVLLVAVTSGATEGLLFRGSTLALLWHQAVPTLLVALGAVAVVARGGFDLSTAAVAALAGGVAARHGSPALGLLAALGCGLANGLLVTLLRVPGWLVTALTLAILSAVCAGVFGGQVMLRFDPDTYDWIVPASAAVAVVAAVLAVVGLQILPRGAAGSRPRDRAADGLPYVFSALLAGVSGLCVAVQVGGATAPRGVGRWPEIAVAVVLGGSFLGAGRVNVIGLVIAVVGWVGVRFGLTAANVSPIVEGVLLVPLLLLALGASVAAHVAVARRWARAHAADAAPAGSTRDDHPRTFDRALFQGPGGTVPVPVHLIDRRWAAWIEVGWNAALVVGLLALAAVAWRVEPRIFENGAFLDDLATSLVLPMLLAIGATVVVARGGWDLSAPAVAALTAYLTARQGEPWAALAVALAVGLVTAALVSVARAPGWLASAAVLVLLMGMRLVLVFLDESTLTRAPGGVAWLPRSGWVLASVAAAVAFLWVQLAPGGDADRPPVRWRERLGDGLPYLFASVLAWLAGTHAVARVGAASLAPVGGAETLPAIILAGCWLGAGRANVVGVMLATAMIGGVEYLGYYSGARPEAAQTTSQAVMCGLALVALAASRVVHLAVGRTYVRRKRAVPDATLSAVQEDPAP